MMDNTLSHSKPFLEPISRAGDIMTVILNDVQIDIPDDLTRGQRITMRVISITTAEPADTVQSLFYRNVVTELGLQYLNTLPENRR